MKLILWADASLFTQETRDDTVLALLEAGWDVHFAPRDVYTSIAGCDAVLRAATRHDPKADMIVSLARASHIPVHYTLDTLQPAQKGAYHG